MNLSPLTRCFPKSVESPLTKISKISEKWETTKLLSTLFESFGFILNRNTSLLLHPPQIKKIALRKQPLNRHKIFSRIIVQQSSYKITRRFFCSTDSKGQTPTAKIEKRSLRDRIKEWGEFTNDVSFLVGGLAGIVGVVGPIILTLMYSIGQPGLPENKITDPKKQRYSLPAHNINRKKLLEDIRQLFTNIIDKDEKRVLVIIGDTTEGKSTAARQYANEFIEDYNHRVLISCKDWERDYREFANEYCLLQENESEEEHRITIEKLHIETIIHEVHKEISKKPSLLIFDGDFNNFVEKTFGYRLPRNADILITANQSDHWPRRIEIRRSEYQLNEQEGMQILKGFIGIDYFDEEGARKIIEKVQNLPVVLANIGATIQLTKMPLDDYLDIFEKKRNGSRDSKGDPKLDVQVSTELLIKELSKESQMLLELCAQIPGEKIPLEFVESVLKEANCLQEKGDSIYQKLAGLNSLVFVDHYESQSFPSTKKRVKVSMHSVIQDIVEDFVIENSCSFGNYPLFIAKTCKKNEDFRLFLQSNKAKALNIYEKVISSFKGELSLENYDELQYFYTQIGMIHKISSDDPKAFEYFDKALKVNIEFVNEETRTVAELYRLMASTLREEDRSQAFIYAKKSQEITKKLNEQENRLDPSTIKSFRMLAWTTADDKAEEALSYLFEAYELGLDLLTDDRPEVARTYQEMGWNIGKLAMRDEKLEYLSQPNICKGYFEIFQEKLMLDKQDHTLLKKCFQSLKLSSAYQTILGKNNLHSIALRCQQKALVINIKALGNNNAYAAKSYSNLGKVFEDVKEYDDAIKCYDKGREIREDVFGKDHLEVAKSYDNLGRNFESRGSYETAKEKYEEALRIANRSPNGKFLARQIQKNLLKLEEKMTFHHFTINSVVDQTSFWNFNE